MCGRSRSCGRSSRSAGASLGKHTRAICTACWTWPSSTARTMTRCRPPSGSGRLMRSRRNCTRVEEAGACSGFFRRLSSGLMTEATELLNAIQHGDPHAAGRLLPLVYEELRRLAARKLEHEAPGQTLEATALVHEAYLRLVGPNPEQRWDGRGHFFAAAAEAMRRILVENARRKHSLKRGGDRPRQALD